MIKDAFRTVDFWKASVMTMPDNSFFELLRSVFGKIKTPFKKQQLMIELETFLLREDIQKNIASFINEDDSKIITAIAFFKEQTGLEPRSEELESFFCDEYSYVQLQDIIVNMEERFVLYRFAHEKTNRLALNPVMKNILLPFTVNISPLFPAFPADASEAPKTYQTAINDMMLAALLSFASQHDCFFRAETTNRNNIVRKRVIESGKACLPGVELVKLTGSMQVLGLFYTDGEKLVPDRKRFDDFAELSVRERHEYYAAALFVYSTLTPSFEILPPLFRNKIRELTNLIDSLLDTLKKEYSYTKGTIGRVLEILKAKTNVNFNNNMLIGCLEKTGLITHTTEELMKIGVIAHNAESVSANPVIAIDSGFSILIYPEINFTDAILLASFMNICEAGKSDMTPQFTVPVISFELDKNAAIKAFNGSFSADEIIELLNRLSGDKVPESLIWNLKDWEKRHGEISLRKGVILSLSEEHRYLTETRPLSLMIHETLAPGLYMMREDSVDHAERALRAAGIDIIADLTDSSEDNQIKRKPSDDDITSSRFLKFSNHFSTPSSSPFYQLDPSAGKPLVFRDDNTAVLNEKFQAVLAKISLSETEKQELSARINRRLILCDTQLKEASVRYEKLEARHMDYSGKQNIAKQAISMQSPVEVVWQSKGEEKIIFGIPKTLEKEKAELILVVQTSSPNQSSGSPAADQADDKVRIPLAKISLLRRIKRSIFEV